MDVKRELKKILYHQRRGTVALDGMPWDATKALDKLIRRLPTPVKSEI